MCVLYVSVRTFVSAAAVLSALSLWWLLVDATCVTELENSLMNFLKIDVLCE